MTRFRRMRADRTALSERTPRQRRACALPRATHPSCRAAIILSGRQTLAKQRRGSKRSRARAHRRIRRRDQGRAVGDESASRNGKFESTPLQRLVCCEPIIPLGPKAALCGLVKVRKKGSGPCSDNCRSDIPFAALSGRQRPSDDRRRCNVPLSPQECRDNADRCESRLVGSGRRTSNSNRRCARSPLNGADLPTMAKRA